jgi:hypothetical protein
MRRTFSLVELTFRLQFLVVRDFASGVLDPLWEVRFFGKHEAGHLSQMYKGTIRLLNQSKFLEGWRCKCSARNSKMF